MKYFFIIALLLFGGIGLMGWWKKSPETVPAEVVKPEPVKSVVQEIALGTSTAPIPPPIDLEEAPEIDRVTELFELDSDLPMVETVSFTSRVPWLKDRPAWIADYASHYETSRHFIARSLNKKADYFTQKIHPGDRFNVLKKEIQFHMLVDLSKCRLWFYCIDQGEKILLKTYRIGAGKLDSSSPSGSLTPLGNYQLRERVAIYKPGVMDFFQDQKIEMIRVFGTRWLPFENELEKGLGFHGAPWVEGPDGQLIEDQSQIGRYESDGSILMAQGDIEEVFAIVITKPTTVEIVKEFKP